MTAHAFDRLSAYLDGELAPEELARVESHVGDCPACARRLEELAAVDDAARRLPVVVPRGYFESLPARVRRHLEQRASPRRWRVPVWAWAAAAAVVLAVLTPATLHRPAPVPTGPSGTAARDDGAQQSAPVSQTLEAPRPAAPAPAPSAGVPERVDRTPGRRPSGPSASAPPAPTPALSRNQAPSGEAELAGFAAAPRKASEETSPAAAPAPGAAPELLAGRDADERVAASAEPTPTPRLETAGVAKRRRAEEHTASMAEAVRVAPPTVEARYRALASRRVTTLEEARGLREAWRALAERDPGGPRADTARVGVIAAGAEAVRLGGDAEDLALLERDGAAYLARRDAAQADRVREILASVAEP
jgi:Putative zinc-finger